ncbi:MAG TPA: AbfB domain-containing protein, partial [Bacillota bacterium]|nr:AbfB domain-containing protein [Bacillota bacterium]
TNLLISDDFNQAKLGLNWQWNHNPDNSRWSLNVRPGYLRLTTGSIASNIHQARNTPSQRTVGPTCFGEVAIETGNMKLGDYAGLAAFQDDYGFIGVKRTDTGKYLVMATNGGSGTPKEVASLALYQDRVYLKINFNFLNCTDKADFYYSLDGNTWTKLGSQLSMTYKLTHFMGYRIALFNYATKSTGGYVDFDYLHTTPASTVTPTATSTPTPTPTNIGTVNRIYSYNFQTHYIRHSGVGAQATIASNVNPLGDSQWKLVPGLADSACVSFESVNYPGYYLRHSGYIVYLNQNDGSATFKADATFREVSGLKDSSWKSYQSYNFPSRYLRHQNFLLKIDPISSSSSDSDKQDATFKRQ